MGSSGTGNFTDYPGTPPAALPGIGGTTGGASGQDACDMAISVWLEEFERCDYWKVHKTPPVSGLAIQVVHAKRIVAQTMGGEVLGYLPTKYNYLAACMAAGKNYSGQVVKVVKDTVYQIKIDVAPS